MNKYLFLFIISVLLLTSCRKDAKQDQKYPNVEFVYMMKGILFFNSLDSPKKVMLNECSVDTIIYDKKKVDTYIALIDNLEDDTLKSHCDFRVVSIIHYNDSTECVACFGERWDTMVDNVRKKDDPQLFDFINNLLYDEISTRRLIIHSLRQDGFGDDIDTPEMQTMIDECMERARKAGDVYPK